MSKAKRTASNKSNKPMRPQRKAAQLPHPTAPVRPRNRQLTMPLTSPHSSSTSSSASSPPTSPVSSPSTSPASSPLSSPASRPVASTMPASFTCAPTPSPPTSPMLMLQPPPNEPSLLEHQASMSGSSSILHAVLSTPPSPTSSLSTLLLPSPVLAPNAADNDHLVPESSFVSDTTTTTLNELIYGEPERTEFKSVIRLNGFQYTKAGTTSKKVTYRCSFYRRREKCKGRVEFTAKDMAFTNFRPHVCQIGPVVANVRNIERKMKDAVDDLVLQNLSISAERVWDRVRDEFYASDGDAVQGLTREQVRRRVYKTRRDYFGGSMHGLVEVPPLSLVQGSTMNFFQFHRVYAHQGTKVERLIGWGHPELIDKLKYKGVTLFVDGTFRCVPRPFYQCVVIMVHDQASDCFLPAFYVLCSSKESDMYWNVIDHVIQATDQKLEPSKVICDFEVGLIKAVLTQFPEAKVSGCFFHFKQALGRRMKRLRIPEPEVKLAMAPGGVDILAVVDREKVAIEGTCYVRKLIREKCVAQGLTYSHHKWETFWSYFDKQWVCRYGPELWNVDGMQKQVVARTNNPLERFNRELNGAFGPHPSLPVFVAGVEALARRHVQVLHDIPANRAKSPRRREKYTLPKKVMLPDKQTASRSCTV